MGEEERKKESKQKPSVAHELSYHVEVYVVCCVDSWAYFMNKLLVCAVM